MGCAEHDAAHANSSSQCTNQIGSLQWLEDKCSGANKICTQTNKSFTPPPLPFENKFLKGKVT